MQETLDLIIVGAGVAGLQALNECLKTGVTAKCLERDAVPGGRKFPSKRTRD
jgi:ribulose 1,5-bisphosphate synthetase/thiazole synthase